MGINAINQSRRDRMIELLTSSENRLVTNLVMLMRLTTTTSQEHQCYILRQNRQFNVLRHRSTEFVYRIISGQRTRDTRFAHDEHQRAELRERFAQGVHLRLRSDQLRTLQVRHPGPLGMREPRDAYSGLGPLGLGSGTRPLETPISSGPLWTTGGILQDRPSSTHASYRVAVAGGPVCHCGGRARCIPPSAAWRRRSSVCRSGVLNCDYPRLIEDMRSRGSMSAGSAASRERPPPSRNRGPSRTPPPGSSSPPQPASTTASRRPDAPGHSR